jgi:hypothetical protein
VSRRFKGVEDFPLTDDFLIPRHCLILSPCAPAKSSNSGDRDSVQKIAIAVGAIRFP